MELYVLMEEKFKNCFETDHQFRYGSKVSRLGHQDTAQIDDSL
jgi:hypothetical protein